MFSYQQQLTDSRTRLITPEVFWAYCRAPQTIQLVTEARQALQNGDEKTYADKKKQLALMIFVGTFEEWEKELENKRTGEKRKETAMWRSQSHVHLNGLVVADYDHLQGDVRKIWAEAYERLSPEDQARIVLVYVTPSGQGLKPVFTADPAIGNLIDNQLDFSRKLGLPLDESCKDGSRGAFMTTADDIIYINEEKLFTYEDEAFSTRFDPLYRDGQSQATQKDNLGSEKKIIESCGPLQDNYNGMPVMEIADKWSQQHFASEGVSRHESSILLARDLLIMLDRDQSQVLSVLKAQPWVQAIIRERGEDVERTVSDAATYLKAQESQAAKKGQPWLPKISKEMQAIVEPLNSKISILNSDADIYSQLPLDKWAEELREMAQYYPCMKELFVNLHPHKLPAVLFSSGALFGTLMTRAWYHFWFDPKIIRRLNYCIFIIGDPGAGKHMIEEFYRLIADPIIQADQCMIDALNRYKESRTERTTSTKAQKAEALKKPEVGIRVHPARTATGEFIRHMLAAKEIIQGHPINLHMLSFVYPPHAGSQGNHPRPSDKPAHAVVRFRARQREQEQQRWRLEGSRDYGAQGLSQRGRRTDVRQSGEHQRHV